MFNIPAITWALTAALLLSGSHHLLQTGKSRRPTDRINNSLHALMHLLMAAMLWNLAPSTMLAQIALLTGAALWFTIQAIARPEFKTLCAGTHGRLKCAYHSLTMAGAALMVTMMAHMSITGHETTPPDTMAAMPAMGAMTMPHDHHAMAATTTATPPLGHSPELAILSTLFFATAALVFTLLLLRRQSPKTIRHNATRPQHSTRTQHALEALGATTMALMFATMTT